MSLSSNSMDPLAPGGGEGRVRGWRDSETGPHESCSLVRWAGGIKDGYSTAAGGSTLMETDFTDLRRPRQASTVAVGAFAVGALAIGALTIGRLTVRRLRVRRSHLRAVRIDDLDVGTLRVESLHTPERSEAAAPSP